MPINKRWAGRIFGTNTGNIFLSIEGPDDNLTGILRVADDGLGVVVYTVAATSDGSGISLTGTPQKVPDGVQAADISGTGKLMPDGRIFGDWQSELGTGGTFQLHPHGAGDDLLDEPTQLHTARHDFGAIEIDKAQVVKIGEKLEAEMKGSVVITVTEGTEQSRLLRAFKEADLPAARAQVLKIVSRARSVQDFFDIVEIEFGPSVNYVSAQSINESWALGTVERFKRELRPNERFYATRVKRWGLSINDVILAWALIILPGLPDIWWRAGWLVGSIVLTRIIATLHDRFIPFATIWLGTKQVGVFAKLSPQLVSWVITVTSGVAVAIASAYVLAQLGIAPSTSTNGT